MNKEELIRRHRELKAESSKLKRDLGIMGKRKSVLFSERDGIKKTFRETIARLKELKAERDRHTGIVKDLKNKRNSASSKIKNLVSGLKTLRDQKDRTKRKLGVKNSSESLSAEISKLEYQIETAALPFEKEKKLMKIIKEKKAELGRAGKLSGIIKNLKDSSTEFRSSKKISEEAHSELKEHVSASQKFHGEMLERAQEADKMKEKLNASSGEAKELASGFTEKRKKLAEVLKSLEETEKSLDALRADEKKRKEQEKAMRIEKTEKELAEKMKSGKKLTTDDLIKLKPD